MTQAKAQPKLYSFDEFIGNPKQPTFFVCNLVDGEYQMTTFTGNTPIVSPTFPQFNLSAQQFFNLAL